MNENLTIIIDRELPDTLVRGLQSLTGYVVHVSANTDDDEPMFLLVSGAGETAGEGPYLSGFHWNVETGQTGEVHHLLVDNIDTINVA